MLSYFAVLNIIIFLFKECLFYLSRLKKKYHLNLVFNATQICDHRKNAHSFNNYYYYYNRYIS